MSDGDEQPGETRFWPLKWAREEKFWRDLAVQVFGTGAVALVAFLYASAAGYLAPTGNNAGFRLTMFLVGVAIALIAVVLLLITIASARQMQRTNGGSAGVRYAVGLGLLFIVQVGIVAVPWFIAVTRDQPVSLGG